MRLELTRKSDLAIRAVRALHKAEGRMPGRELSKTIETTTPFIAQVVAPLVQRGWLDSKPGPSGGYGLTVDPNTLMILDIIEVIEGPLDNGICVLAGGPCGFDTCSVHEVWGDARSALTDAFGNVSVVQD